MVLGIGALAIHVVPVARGRVAMTCIIRKLGVKLRATISKIKG